MSRMVYVLIAAGFAALGFLVGSVAGLSTAELTTMLLGMLFALIGGSVAVFLGKLDAEGRRLAGLALLAFSIPATIALYSGIYVRINDLLSRTPGAAGPGEYLYLRGLSVDEMSFLRQQLLREEITLEQACRALIEGSSNATTKK